MSQAKIKVKVCGCYSGSSKNMNLPLGWNRNFKVCRQKQEVKQWLISLISLYPHIPKKVRVYCCITVGPFVTFYFLKLLLHLINQQTKLLEFDLGCRVVCKKDKKKSMVVLGSNNWFKKWCFSPKNFSYFFNSRQFIFWNTFWGVL